MATTAQQNIEQYLTVLAVERRLSIHTIKAYQRDIDEFIGFHTLLDFNNIELITDIEVSQFFIHLFQNGIKAKSIARYKSSLNRIDYS